MESRRIHTINREDSEPIEMGEDLVLGLGVIWNGNTSFTEAHKPSLAPGSYIRPMPFYINSIRLNDTHLKEVKVEYSFSKPVAIGSAFTCLTYVCRLKTIASFTKGYDISAYPSLTFKEQTAIVKVVAKYIHQPARHVTLNHLLNLPFRGPASMQAWIKYLTCTISGKFYIGTRVYAIAGSFSVTIPVTSIRGTLDLVMGLQPSHPKYLSSE
ncbi:hypothetical protein DSO57_1007713 [Entomophthora muscae]|uniref:Uncharacterized protein n=1 Tax=Entomophthora muscae TaxID=34485 RepID=A0ACC2SW71_9FUNG|nr:hypothetical protein DSO57_1007713 [Entomophthora muscae]